MNSGKYSGLVKKKELPDYLFLLAATARILIARVPITTEMGSGVWVGVTGFKVVTVALTSVVATGAGVGAAVTGVNTSPGVLDFKTLSDPYWFHTVSLTS